jgi:EmrB/QacA subfamily drug resistance transporter
VCGLAGNASLLIGARAVQAVGAALMNPATLSIITATFPPRQRGMAIGIWAGVSALGLSVGPLVGGFLVERVSWSAVFWVNVPIGAIAAVVCLWAVTESRDERHRHLDAVGTALVTTALFALVVGLIGTSSNGWTSATTLGLLAAAAVLSALFIAWEHHNREPMVPLRFFLRPAFSTSTIVSLLVGFAFIGVLYLIVLYFQNVMGYSPLEAGVRTLPLTLTQAVTAANAGRLNRTLGARAKMSVGLLLLSAGLFGLAQIQVTTSYTAIWPFQVLLGLGMGLVMPAVAAAGMAAVAAEQSGVASGVINASRQVGGALGIAVLGSIAATITRTDWHQQLSQLPAATQAKAGHLTALVVGGQGPPIAAAAGRPAELAALASFVDGTRGALLTSSALVLIASAVAFAGLRPRPGPAACEPGDSAADGVAHPAGAASPTPVNVTSS